jgi:hypothetical protein
MFSDIKKQVADNFKEMSSGELFYVNIDREKAWEEYLSGFPEELKQEYTCNSCRSFIRQWSGIVSIAGNKIRSIWDGINARGPANLATYVHSLPIVDVFRNDLAKCGVDKNFDPIKNLNWTHLHIELPQKFVLKSNLDAQRGEMRAAHDTLKRALDELSIPTIETVLELIAQNSLYKGKESEGLLQGFLVLLKEYKTLPVEQRDPFAWEQSRIQSPAMCRLRGDDGFAVNENGTIRIPEFHGTPEEMGVYLDKMQETIDEANNKKKSENSKPRP